ncbi:Protein casc1 [Rhizophlyctis rosea]|nr:Protein casc1 [Rhizophlyctis rosea]
MPASKPGTGKEKKGKGKGKKSKKELERGSDFMTHLHCTDLHSHYDDNQKPERIAAEEARLAEEARIAEARAKKEREAKEQAEREALEALFNQAQTRLEEETEEIRRVTDTKAAELNIHTRAIQQELEWKKYLECSKLPSPKSEREMNSYLTLWSETPLHEEGDDPSLAPLIKMLPEVDELCTNLESALASATQPETSILTNHLIHLRHLITAKWDQATADILQYLDYFHRENNENFQLADMTDGYVFGVWGNFVKNPRYKSVEFTPTPLQTTLPKPLALASVAIRMLYQSSAGCTSPFEVQESGTHVSPVGGILYLDLVEMPEPPKTVESWTIRQLLTTNGTLRRLSYPFKKPASPDHTSEEDPDAENSSGGTDATAWPLQLTYVAVPGAFVRKEAATVKWWNEETKGWDGEGVEGVEVDEETGTVKFKTIHFAPTALVQNSYAEFPYHDWTITPTTLSTATVTILGRLGDLELEVGEGVCRLIRPRSAWTEKNLGGRWMEVGILFKRLSEIGLNFRGPRTLKGVDLEDFILKNPTSEDMCISGISICSPCFEFRRSPANRKLSSSKVAFQARELGWVAEQQAAKAAAAEGQGEGVKSVEEVAGGEGGASGEEGGGENDSNENKGWTTIVFDANWVVNNSPHMAGFALPDGDDLTDAYKFNADNANGHTIHSTVYHTLRPLIKKEENQAKIEQGSVMFTKTLAQVMSIARMLCFS